MANTPPLNQLTLEELKASIETVRQFQANRETSAFITVNPAVVEHIRWWRTLPWWHWRKLLNFLTWNL